MRLFRWFKSGSLRSRRGNSLIEFALTGIPVIFITTSIVAMSLDMWEFHNMAYATDMTARYISMHGATCIAQNCPQLQIQDIVTFFNTQAIALYPGTTVLTLTNNAQNPTPCNPISSCASNTTPWPDAGDNLDGQNITVTATYILKNPIFLFWPPDTSSPHDFTVGATSTQVIIF